jgi:hypothetical protein
MKKEFSFEEEKRYMDLSNKKRNEYDNRLYSIQHRRYDSVIFEACKIIGAFLTAVLIIETLGFLNNVNILYELGKSLFFDFWGSMSFIFWISLMGEIVNAIIYRRNTNKQICKLKEEFGLTDGKRL